MVTKVISNNIFEIQTDTYKLNYFYNRNVEDFNICLSVIISCLPRLILCVQSCKIRVQWEHMKSIFQSIKCDTYFDSYMYSSCFIMFLCPKHINSLTPWRHIWTGPNHWFTDQSIVFWGVEELLILYSKFYCYDRFHITASALLLSLYISKFLLWLWSAFDIFNVESIFVSNERIAMDCERSE